MSPCSTPCSARERISEESTDSLSNEDNGVPQTSRQRFSTKSQKDTFEQMFYHIPTRKNPEKQGLIKGFPGVLQSKWCVKLKIRCFLKAPSVSYQDSKSRDTARNELVRLVDRVRREDTEKILNQLTLLNYSNERIERRQLRIWRQLKALLGLSMEGE